MGRVMSGLLGLLAILAAGRPARAEAPPKPRLVVAIAIDQFSWALYQRYRPSFTGGLARLSSGEVFEGYQSHGATETCPGHSTILTGDHPSRTGIAGNGWFDRATGSSTYCVAAVGVADPLAKSAAFLKVDTLGDWMRRADPAARVVSVSGKDRAAIMMAGHHPSAVFWWTDGLGFGTSRLAGPADAATTAPARAFDAQLLTKWRRTPPQLWPANLPERCAALQTPGTFGKLTLNGQVPPESALAVKDGPFDTAAFEAELRASPLIDQLTAQMAQHLVAARKLGRGRTTDLLAISFSGTDFVGHRFGPGGAEMCVQLASLDAAMGVLFAQLDALKIPYVVVATADHGSIDAAERLGPPAQRIDVAGLLDRLNRRLKDRFGLTYDPLLTDDAEELILNLAPEDAKRREAITAEALAWLRARPEVAQASTADEVAAAVPPRGKPAADLSLLERQNESFDRERSGDILVVYAKGASLGLPLGPGANIAGHGTPWDYDRQVPILFWWPGVSARDAARPIETVDIAPTLAAMIGLPAPDVDGRCIDLGQGCPKP